MGKFTSPSCRGRRRVVFPLNFNTRNSYKITKYFSGCRKFNGVTLDTLYPEMDLNRVLSIKMTFIALSDY